jgi:hypothetical protein
MMKSVSPIDRVDEARIQLLAIGGRLAGAAGAPAIVAALAIMLPFQQSRKVLRRMCADGNSAALRRRPGRDIDVLDRVGQHDDRAQKSPDLAAHDDEGARVEVLQRVPERLLPGRSRQPVVPVDD